MLRLRCVIVALSISIPFGAIAETRVLVVGTPPDHPPGSHLYEQDGQLLAAHLRRLPNVVARATIGWPVASSELEDLDVLVFYSSPVGEIVLRPEHRNRFVELMRHGTGLVCIHWSTGVGYSEIANQPELRDTFKELLGGWFRRPPCDIQVGSARLNQVASDHLLCRGWQEYTLHDEFYLNPVLHERSQPIVQVDVDGKRHTVVWAYERSSEEHSKEKPSVGGRSVGITLGHFHDNFEDARFRRLLINATLWTANKQNE